MLAVQYLEPGPDVAALASADIRAQLRAAFERLPMACVILGWDLPPALVEACAREVTRANAQLYLWHPLLTGSATFGPRRQWEVIALTGEPVPAFRGLPEFAFLCPNRPSAVEAALERLRRVVRHGPYQGVFLDRIRYPSPANGPDRLLACFCPDCHRAAAEEGLDLAAAQQSIQTLLAAPERLRSFVQLLLDPSIELTADDDLAMLQRFLDFRVHCITHIVQAAAGIVHGEGLAVGLDCFSPVLTHMVGQDLAALNAHCGWIKVMTYGHTLGPAGLPYELLDLVRWLIMRTAAREAEALEWLALAAHLPLPSSLDALGEQGLSPEALGREVRRGRAAGVSTLLAGIELVELKGVTRLDQAQIAADLHALREARPNGLVLSWDLRRIPLQRLEVVQSIWLASHSPEGSPR
jgi:hypothetical protein